MRAAYCLILAGFWLGACAEVKVRKITPQNAACTEGFRYYLPRPFVSVKAPMPVAGDQFIVNGRLEGGVVTVAASALPEWMSKQHFRAKDGNVYIPAGSVYDSTLAARPRKQGDDAAAQQAGEEGDDSAGEAAAPAAEKPSGGTAEAGSAAQDPEGYGSLVVDAGGKYFNVIYLPDFDEQYAIKFEPGLGRAGTGESPLRLRHGWMLESISVDVDNTKLGEFIFAQVDRFTGILGKVLEKELGIEAPKAEEPAAADSPASPGAAQQAGTGKKRRRAREVFDVSLRVTFVIEAQPGVYPVLKPCEKERFVADAERFDDFRYSKGWTFVPYSPLTVVPYNVKRQVLVEALSLEPAAEPGAPRAPQPPPPPKDEDFAGRVGNLANADDDLKKLLPGTEAPESSYATPSDAIEKAVKTGKNLVVTLKRFKIDAAKAAFRTKLEAVLKAKAAELGVDADKVVVNA